MGQIFGVVGSCALFFSFVAYYEVRDRLQTASRPVLPGFCRMWGLGAGGLVMLLGVLVCLTLAANGG